jgi:hypothetical protein
MCLRSQFWFFPHLRSLNEQHVVADEHNLNHYDASNPQCLLLIVLPDLDRHPAESSQICHYN